MALTTWYLVVEPNISDLIETFLPNKRTGYLIVGGILFSMINAAVEEGAYRGVIMHALDKSLGHGIATLVLQAATFGIHHINGCPRGWLGVVPCRHFRGAYWVNS